MGLHVVHPLLNNAINDQESAMLTDFADGAQMLDKWRRRYYPNRIDSNEKLLLLAILQDAIASVLNFNIGGGYARKVKHGYDYTERKLLRDAAEDRRWFESRERWDWGSFNNVWTTLFPDYDLERARREILENPDEIRRRIKLKVTRNQYSEPREDSDDEC